MKFPAPTRKDHLAFCLREGWREVRRPGGGKVAHHRTFELDLPAGSALRTRISHPAGRQDYGPALWAAILKDQLQVDEAQFWACAREGSRPDRGVVMTPPEALPADLVHLLITRGGMTERAVRRLTREEAIARVQTLWTAKG